MLVGRAQLRRRNRAEEKGITQREIFVQVKGI